MSRKTYFTVCATVVAIGALLTVAQLLADGPSLGDFISLVVGVPLGLIAATVVRRNA